MAYDEGLAQRIREFLQDQGQVTEKKMFGGLCFMVNGHMGCGILGERLMARVGPEAYGRCLEKAHAAPMDFTGRPMKGMVFVEPEGIEQDDDLEDWLMRCLDFVNTLPPG